MRIECKVGDKKLLYQIQGSTGDKMVQEIFLITKDLCNEINGRLFHTNLTFKDYIEKKARGEVKTEIKDTEHNPLNLPLVEQ